MSIRKRGNAYQYRIMRNGTCYAGVCRNCATLEEARKYEMQMRAMIDDLARQKSVKAIIENYREELEGGEGGRIAIAAMWDIAGARAGRRSVGEKEAKCKLSRWLDFVHFVRKCKYADEITDDMANAYVLHLMRSGRAKKAIEYRRDRKVVRTCARARISAETINRHIKTCREIFRKCRCRNPFAEIPLLAADDSTEREPFTLEELGKVIACGDAVVADLFAVGINTGLREADICGLKWTEIDYSGGVITVQTRKTGRRVSIPILEGLTRVIARHLYNGSEYLLPEAKQLYDEGKIGKRVKKVLDGLGIKNTVEGAGKRVSVKDVHSLRHTFCYLAGLAGIPLVIVQSIVGHLSERMTEHYTQHADNKAKEKALRKYAELIGGI